MMRKRGHGSYVAESSDGGGTAGGKADAHCQVLLLDGTEIALGISRKTPGQCVFDSVLRKLDLLERDYFGLLYDEEQSKTQQWLDLMRPVKKQVRSKGQCQLFFCMKVYPSDPLSLQESTRMQLYWQVKRDFIESRLRCSPAGLVKLAAFVAQTELNDLDIESQAHNYLPSLGLVLPELRRLENEIMEEHKQLRGTSPHSSLSSFLKMASTLDSYGTNYFEIKYEAKVPYILEVSPFGVAMSKGNKIVRSYAWKDISKVTYNGKKLSITVGSMQGVQGSNALNFEVESLLYCRSVFQTIVSHLNHHRDIAKASKAPSSAATAAKEGLPAFMEPKQKANGTRSLGKHRPAPPPPARARLKSAPPKVVAAREGISRALPDLPQHPEPVTSSSGRSQSISHAHTDPVYAEVKPKEHAGNQEMEEMSLSAVLQALPVSKVEGENSSSDSNSQRNQMHDSLLDLAEDLGNNSDGDTPPEQYKPGKPRANSLDTQSVPGSTRETRAELLTTGSFRIPHSQAPPHHGLAANEPDLTRDIPVFAGRRPFPGRNAGGILQERAFSSQREFRSLSHREQHSVQPQHRQSLNLRRSQSPPAQMLLPPAQMLSSPRDALSQPSPQTLHKFGSDIQREKQKRESKRRRPPPTPPTQKALSLQDSSLAQSSPQLHHTFGNKAHSQEQKEQAKLLIHNWVQQQKIKDLENAGSHYESPPDAHNDRDSRHTHDPFQSGSATSFGTTESSSSSPDTYKLRILPPQSPKDVSHHFQASSLKPPSSPIQPHPTSSTLPRPSPPSPSRPYMLTRPCSSPLARAHLRAASKTHSQPSPNPSPSPSFQQLSPLDSQGRPSSSPQPGPPVSSQARLLPSPQPDFSLWSSPSPEPQSSLPLSQLPLSRTSSPPSSLSDPATEKEVLLLEQQQKRSHVVPSAPIPDWYDVPQSCLATNSASNTYDVLPPTRPALTQQELLQINYPDYDVPVPSYKSSLGERPDSAESASGTDIDRPGSSMAAAPVSPLSDEAMATSNRDNSVEVIVKHSERAAFDLNGTKAQLQRQGRDQSGRYKAKRPASSASQGLSSTGPMGKKEAEPPPLHSPPAQDDLQKKSGQKPRDSARKPAPGNEKPIVAQVPPAVAQVPPAVAQVPPTAVQRPTDLDQARRRSWQRELTPPSQETALAPPVVVPANNMPPPDSIYDRLLAVTAAENDADLQGGSDSSVSPAAATNMSPTSAHVVGGLPDDGADVRLPFPRQPASGPEHIMASLQEVMFVDPVPVPPAHLTDLSNEIENILQGSAPPVHPSSQFDPDFFVKQAVSDEKKRKQHHQPSQLPPDVARFMNWVRLSSDVSEDQTASCGGSTSSLLKSHRKQGSHGKERETSIDSSSPHTHSRTDSKTDAVEGEVPALVAVATPTVECTTKTKPPIALGIISPGDLPTPDASTQLRLPETHKGVIESPSSTIAVKDFPAYKAELQPTTDFLEEQRPEAVLLDKPSHAEVRVLHYSSFEKLRLASTDHAHYLQSSQSHPTELHLESNPYHSQDDSLPNSPSYYTQNPLEAKMRLREVSPQPAHVAQQPLLSELDNQSSGREKQSRVADWMETSQLFWKNADQSKLFHMGATFQTDAAPLTMSNGGIQGQPAKDNPFQPMATPSDHTQTRVRRREHLYEDPDQFLQSSFEERASSNVTKMGPPQPFPFRDSFRSELTGLHSKHPKSSGPPRVQSLRRQDKPRPSSARSYPIRHQLVNQGLKQQGPEAAPRLAKMYATDV